MRPFADCVAPCALNKAWRPRQSRAAGELEQLRVMEEVPVSLDREDYSN
jgi:hypothetical protein